jgi:CRISPR-associated protein Csc3
VTSTDGMAPYLAERLTDYYTYITYYYQTILGEGGSKMGLIEALVDKYASFYRARGRAAFGRLRPISLAADVILDSPPELDRESLQLQIEGRIFAMLDGVRDRVTEGWIPKGAWTDAERQPFVEDFARYFLEDIFDGYCHKDRALLRTRLNLLKNGCEAIYVKKYGMKQTTEKEGTPDIAMTETQSEGGNL